MTMISPITALRAKIAADKKHCEQVIRKCDTALARIDALQAKYGIAKK